MKSIIYGKNGHVAMITRDTGIPACRQFDKVLVKVYCAGLNPADAKEIMGDKVPHSWKSARSLLKWHLQDKTPGFDFAGEVMACPSGFYSRGDYVFGTMPPFQGSLSEYVIAPVDQVCLKPTSLTMEEAAAFPLVGLTALQSLSPHINSLEESSSVLIIGGSGGVGHVAIQIAKALGAASVTTICSRYNIDFVRALGADYVVDYTRGQVIPDLEDCVSQIGKPYDLVLDCVSSGDPRDTRQDYVQSITDHMYPSVLVDGPYVRIGGSAKDWVKTGCERAVPILFANGKPFDCWRGPSKLFCVRYPQSSGELKQLRDWAQEGKVKPVVAEVKEFTAEGVQSGFDDILSRRVQGKIVVRIRR